MVLSCSPGVLSHFRPAGGSAASVVVRGCWAGCCVVPSAVRGGEERGLCYQFNSRAAWPWHTTKPLSCWFRNNLAQSQRLEMATCQRKPGHGMQTETWKWVIPGREGKSASGEFNLQLLLLTHVLTADRFSRSLCKTCGDSGQMHYFSLFD